MISEFKIESEKENGKMAWIDSTGTDGLMISKSPDLTFDLSFHSVCKLNTRLHTTFQFLAAFAFSYLHYFGQQF